MLRLFHIIVLCVLAIQLHGQVDSLLLLASQAEEDSVSLHFTHAAVQRIHTDTSIILLHRSLSKARSIPHSYWIAKLSQTLGKKCDQINGDVDSLYFYSQQAQKLFLTLNIPIESARSTMQMGMAEMARGNREIAINHFTDAASIFEREQAYSVLAPVYINMSYVMRQSEDIESQFNYLLKAYRITLKSGDLRNRAIASMGIQSYFVDKGQLDSATIYAEAAMQLARTLNDPILLRYSALNLGKLELNKGNLRSAENYYLQLLSPTLAGHEQARALYWVGMFYADTEQYKAANQYFEKALTFATEQGANDLRISILTKWRHVLANLGYYQKSFEVTNQYLTLNDSIHSADVRARINELTIQYETEKKERENQELSASLKQNELEILQLNSKVKQQFLITALAILSLISILFFYLLNKRNQRQKTELAKQRAILQERKIKELETEQILTSIKSLVKGQEEERSRIAKELHDGLGSIMSSLKLSISQLPNYSERMDYQHQVQHALTLSDHANHELRRIAQNLMPETLTRFGLIAALEDFIAEINFTKAINIQFQYFYNDSELADDLSLSIYRIIQELLQNALKHSKATEILVQLMKHDQLINITVEDDGDGIDKDLNNTGSGFSNIQSRLTFFGGSMRIESTKGEGTSIFIECPINKSKEQSHDTVGKH